MTVIRPNSISGITSITAQSGTLEFYDAAGSTLTVTGNVNSSGVSTFSTLTATTISGVSTVGVTSVYLDSINDLNYPTAGPLSNRNLIINGAMQVAQRGTSTSISASSTGFAADRFKLANVTEAVVTLSRETTGNPVGFNYWSKVLVTTADTSIASNQYFTYSQLIEGYNTSQLNYGTANAKNVTVSFYFKTNKIGTYCMIHRNNAADRNYLYEFTPSDVDTWERIEYTIPGDTSGVWDIASAIGWRFELTLSNGTAYQSSTTEQWFSGQYYHSTQNQVNFLDALNNYIGITGVQVEIGENATEFEHRSYGQELALCQRYFETSFNGGVSVNNTSNSGLFVWGGSNTGDTTSFIGNAFVFLAVPKRSSPTVTIYDMANPRNTGKCSRHRLGVAQTPNQNVVVSATPGINGFDVYSGGSSAGTGILFHFTASSEL